MSETKIPILATGKSGKLKLTSPKSAKTKSGTVPRARSRAKAPRQTDTAHSASVVESPAAPVISASPSPKLSTLASTPSKATLYVDVEDEITTIINKVQDARGSIIALVLPKRAAVLQSIVNMKLLKRTAEQAGKNLVLVTSEESLRPLAGLIGLHVADTPTSKPFVPSPPDTPSEEPENIDDSLDDGEFVTSADDPEFDQKTEAATPIGDLAGLPTAQDTVEEVVLDAQNTPEPQPSVHESTVPAKRDKKLAVPSFNVFRLRIILVGLGIVLLVVGWVFATRVMPKASIAISTNSQVVASNLTMTLDTAAKTIDQPNSIIPATTQTIQKNYSQQVAATGQQNNGEKASGSVTFSATVCASSGTLDPPADIPAGSSVTAGSHTYILQEKASYGSPSIKKTCLIYTTKSVAITARKAGVEYNVPAGTTFSSGGTGSASGGTDVIVKVIAQSDIDAAKAKIASQDTAQVKQDLQAALRGKGVLPIVSTFLAGEQQITTSAKVGDQAETVSVSSVVPYTMLGVRHDDIRSLVLANVKKEIDVKKQKILDDGVAKASFSQQQPGTATGAVVTAKVQSVAGPELRVDELKRQMVGKKASTIKEDLRNLPGVTDVRVEYRPFWVSTAPKDAQKITITIAQPNGAK